MGSGLTPVDNVKLNYRTLVSVQRDLVNCLVWKTCTWSLEILQVLR